MYSLRRSLVSTEFYLANQNKLILLLLYSVLLCVVFFAVVYSSIALCHNIHLLSELPEPGSILPYNRKSSKQRNYCVTISYRFFQNNLFVNIAFIT